MDMILLPKHGMPSALSKAKPGGEQPFFLMMAWGTPHAPYHTAPENYRQMYDSASIQLRPNVPESIAGRARKDLAGYYAHCTAIDDMLKEILQTLEQTGLAENTIVLFTSDHGRSAWQPWFL